ncbi:MAG: glycosyltransferase [Burkholderiaceae bacterium]
MIDDGLRVHLVSATRRDKDAFWAETALGMSLRRLAGDPRLVPWIAYDNGRGLPEIYNELIANAAVDGLLVFIHDDVWIDDLLFAERVIAGCDAYDVIGVAGNRRRLRGQPGWAFTNMTFTWDAPEHLSGMVGHGQQAFGKVTRYGPTPAACELLDGVMLAGRASTLRSHDCRFDARFRFHFYDIDFCRTVRAAGLRLGTWPIGLTHQSGGAFGTEPWLEGLRTYRAKWGD